MSLKRCVHGNVYFLRSMLMPPQNGETRSLCVALECFSSLFPFTRPSKCSVYAQNLVPVLLRLISREEESLHDALQDAFLKFLPTLTPFMSLANIKVNSRYVSEHCSQGIEIHITYVLQ